MDAVTQAVKWLHQADLLVVTAGAGMGVDSGLPDFRGDQGFWRAYPALGNKGLRFAEVASAAMFKDDPRLAWGFYGHRLGLYRTTKPHPGFAILKRWIERMPLGGVVFTSNVDGQFQRAGFEVDTVTECHGSIHHFQCQDACTDAIWSADSLVVEVDEKQCLWTGAIPRCPSCGSVSRPNILMFNDHGWIDARTESQRAMLNKRLEAAKSPVVIEFGAGTQVATVRHFGGYLTRRYGGRMVRINPVDFQIDPVFGVGLAGSSLSGLTTIDNHFVQQA